MSGLDWALVALAGAGALLLFVLALVTLNLFRVVTSLRALVDGLTQQTIPLLGEVTTTVRTVNGELERMDAIVGSVQRIAGNVESVSGAVRSTVTNPLVKALAFFAGARRAGKAFKDK